LGTVFAPVGIGKMASAPDTRPTDEEILAHQRQVQEAELSRPPIGVVEPLEVLLDEYKDNAAFQRQIRVRLVLRGQAGPAKAQAFTVALPNLQTTPCASAGVH